MTTGSKLSDDSGVAGVAGEGDLEHAVVVDEEDMRIYAKGRGK